MLEKKPPILSYIKSLALFALATTFMPNCLGHPPHPVAVDQESDKRKSCEELSNEITQINRDLKQMDVALREAEMKDEVASFASAIFFPLSILRDFRKAERVEYNALKNRYNHLVKIEHKSECGFEHSLKPVQEQCSDYFTIDCFR